MIFGFIPVKLLLLILTGVMGIFGIVVMVWFFVVLYMKIRRSELEQK